MLKHNELLKGYIVIHNLLDLHTLLTLKYPPLHLQLSSIQLSKVVVQFDVSFTLQLAPKLASLTEIQHNQNTIYKSINKVEQ